MFQSIIILTDTVQWDDSPKILVLRMLVERAPIIMKGLNAE
jgi:hypothetical protein